MGRCVRERAYSIKLSLSPAPRRNISGISPSERRSVSVPMVDGPLCCIVSNPCTTRRSTSPKMENYFSVAKVGFAKDSIAEIGSIKVSAAEIDCAEIGSIEVSVDEGSIAKTGSVEISPKKICSAEIRQFKISIAEISIAEVGPGKVSFSKISFSKVGPAEISKAEIGFSEVSAAEVNAGKISTTEVNTSEISLTEVNFCIKMLFSPRIPDVHTLSDQIKMFLLCHTLSLPQLFPFLYRRVCAQKINRDASRLTIFSDTCFRYCNLMFAGEKTLHACLCCLSFSSRFNGCRLLSPRQKWYESSWRPGHAGE